MCSDDNWHRLNEGCRLPDGYVRLDLPEKWSILRDFLARERVFHYRVFGKQRYPDFVLIAEHEFDNVRRGLAIAIARDEQEVIRKRQRNEERERRVINLADFYTVQEAIISGCQAASRLDAGEFRNKAMQSLQSWVKFLRDAGYFASSDSAAGTRHVHFIVDDLTYRYLTEVRMPYENSEDWLPPLYWPSESCFEEDIIILDAALRKLSTDDLIERKPSRQELDQISLRNQAAERQRKKVAKRELKRQAAIRSENVRVARNERARIRRHEKKNGIIHAPERTKKQAREAGLQTADYFMRRSVRRIPRRGEIPEIIKECEFYSESQTERLLSITAAKKEGLVPREDAIPATVYFHAKARMHYFVYRECEFVPVAMAANR